MTNRICPPGMEKNPNSVRKFLEDLLAVANSSLMGVEVPLEALLGAGTLTETAEYRVPAEYDLVVFQMQATYRSTALNTEPALNANLSLDLQGLAEARLGNVLGKLQLVDRKLDVIEGADLNMAARYRTPAFWLPSAPLIIPAAQTLRATFNAQSGVAAVIGNDAYYGFLLTGVLIPHVP